MNKASTSYSDYLQTIIDSHGRTIKGQTERIQELMGALLWLRDHYDAFKENERLEVVGVIDGVLQAEPRLIAADVRAFQHRYLGFSELSDL